MDDFELRGRKLGRLEIEAQNRVLDGAQREWRLGKFNLLMPEAVFTANGNWAALQATAAGASPGAQRRTVLNFRLDILDSGQLLGRIGMADVVRRGKGRMEGLGGLARCAHQSDYASMTGQINLNIEAGQFPRPSRVWPVARRAQPAVVAATAHAGFSRCVQRRLCI